jgi:hypothetical protein
MIDKLIKLAELMESRGNTKELDIIDSILQKIAEDSMKHEAKYSAKKKSEKARPPKKTKKVSKS